MNSVGNTHSSQRRNSTGPAAAVAAILVLTAALYLLFATKSDKPFTLRRGDSMSSSEQANMEFPVKGMACEEAKSYILKKDPSLEVVCVPDGSMVTMDYNEKRVRVFHDKSMVVVDNPIRG